MAEGSRPHCAFSGCCFMLMGQTSEERHMKRLITVAVMGLIATAFAGCITI